MELASFVFDFGKPSMPFWMERAALVAQLLLVFIVAYHTALWPAGLRFRRPRRFAPPEKSFAVLVPAHDEEAVIGELIDNLAYMRYPRHLYDVYIIADNCSDATAAVARARGAEVFERRDPERRGKPFAVEYALGRLWSQPRRHDAVVILDADNLVAPDFLAAMNTRLLRGERIIQGYLDVKNPDDTWVSASFALSYWVSNRFWCLAKHNLGFTVPLGGTGMCIDMETLRRVGWGTATLTEDLEFTVRALLQGIRTTWAHEAVVFDEKPLTFAQSWRQRLRWVQGAAQVAVRFLPALLREGFRRGDLVLLESAVMVSRPFLVALAAVSGGAFFLVSRHYSADPPIWTLVPREAFLAVAGLQYLLPFAAILLDRVPARPFRFLPLFPLFAYSWIPLTCLGVLRGHRREWSHTRHTRGISYSEMVRRRALDLGGPSQP